MNKAFTKSTSLTEVADALCVTNFLNSSSSKLHFTWGIFFEVIKYKSAFHRKKCLLVYVQEIRELY